MFEYLQTRAWHIHRNQKNPDFNRYSKGTHFENCSTQKRIEVFDAFFRCLGLQAFMTWRMLETQALQSVVSRSLVLGSGLQRRNAMTCNACHGIAPLQGPLLGSEGLAHSFSPAVAVGCFRHCCLFLTISQMTWVPVPEQLRDCPENCLSRRFTRKDQRPLLDILLARMVCHAVRAGQRISCTHLVASGDHPGRDS